MTFYLSPIHGADSNDQWGKDYEVKREVSTCCRLQTHNFTFTFTLICDIFFQQMRQKSSSFFVHSRGTEGTEPEPRVTDHRRLGVRDAAPTGDER